MNAKFGKDADPTGRGDNDDNKNVDDNVEPSDRLTLQ